MSNSMLMKGNSVAFFCLALLFLTTNLAFAACDPAAYDQELTLQGVGTAYVGNLRFDPAKDEAELSDGVCFVSASKLQLTLSAPTMRVERVQTEPRFVAQGATLTLATYTVFAEELSGNAGGLELRNLSVMSPQFSGTAVRAHYTLAAAQTIFSGVNLRLGNFRVEGTAAGLTENTLVLRSARATTCACENGGLYALTAPDVVIDLASGLVRVERGVLETLGLRFGLTPNLRLLLGGAPRPGGGRVQVGGAALLPAQRPRPNRSGRCLTKARAWRCPYSSRRGGSSSWARRVSTPSIRSGSCRCLSSALRSARTTCKPYSAALDRGCAPTRWCGGR